jgi:hypothetical protein
MNTEIEITRSAMTLAGGALGFAGACIAFMNSRLQAATTAEARKNLYDTLLVIVQLLSFIAAFGMLFIHWWWSGVGLLFGSFIIQCFRFIVFPGSDIRRDTLGLIISGLSIVALTGSISLTDFSGKLVRALDPTPSNEPASKH